MGYKICTPGVQVFLGYEKAKWGIVPPNGVPVAALNTCEKRFCISSKLGIISTKNIFLFNLNKLSSQSSEKFICNSIIVENILESTNYFLRRTFSITPSAFFY
jgi:hypothetical protein